MPKTRDPDRIGSEVRSETGVFLLPYRLRPSRHRRPFPRHRGSRCSTRHRINTIIIRAGTIIIRSASTRPRTRSRRILSPTALLLIRSAAFGPARGNSTLCPWPTMHNANTNTSGLVAPWAARRPFFRFRQPRQPALFRRSASLPRTTFSTPPAWLWARNLIA